MNINKAFPSKYIKAADLNGRRARCIISEVCMEDIGDDSDKAVVYFQGKNKGLVLNRTNANMIAEIAGTEETEDWSGIGIVIYPTKTDFGGKRVDCIRVEAPEHKEELPPPPPLNDGNDDIPF